MLCIKTENTGQQSARIILWCNTTTTSVNDIHVENECSNHNSKIISGSNTRNKMHTNSTMRI